MAGCLPMLLQMPILIAFSDFPLCLRTTSTTFLWAEDLSTYDSILDFSFNIPFYGDHVSLFTLLMTIATLVYTWLNNKLMSPANGETNQNDENHDVFYAYPISRFIQQFPIGTYLLLSIGEFNYMLANVDLSV